MAVQHTIPKLVALILVLNGILCPCTVLAGQAEAPDNVHHHEQPVQDLTEDCHGSTSTAHCSTAMTDIAVPDSLPVTSDKLYGDELAPASAVVACDTPRYQFSVGGAPPQSAAPPPRSTPVSRNDRLLD